MLHSIFTILASWCGVVSRRKLSHVTCALSIYVMHSQLTGKFHFVPQIYAGHTTTMNFTHSFHLLLLPHLETPLHDTHQVPFKNHPSPLFLDFHLGHFQDQLVDPNWRKKRVIRVRKRFMKTLMARKFMNLVTSTMWRVFLKSVPIQVTFNHSQGVHVIYKVLWSTLNLI